MPDHEREDGARMRKIVVWVNAGAALGAAALLGVGAYLLLGGDGLSPSSTPGVESLEAAPPRSGVDVDTRAPDVPPPAAEGPTAMAAELAPNLTRPDRRRSAEAAPPRPAGGPPPAAERRTARVAEDALDLARPERSLIQAGLMASGLEPGPADGMFGTGTRSAIRAWQAGRGLPATGYLNAAEAEDLLALGRGRGEGRRAAARLPRADVEDSEGRLTVRAEPASRIELDGAAEDPTARAEEDSRNLARSDRRPSAEAAAPRPAAATDARVPDAAPTVAEGQTAITPVPSPASTPHPTAMPRTTTAPRATSGPSFSCSEGPSPNPLFRAVEKGNLEIAKILAELCPEHVNTEHQQAFRLYETPLSLAVKAQATEMVRILVDAGADLNKSLQQDFRLSLSPLDIAIKEGYTKIANILLGRIN